MKVSYDWIKEYVNVHLEPEKVAEILTNTGLEVEGTEEYESIKGGLDGVVIGEVLSVKKHPNADNLSLTEVNLGNGKVVPVVCGAPNVQAGQKVPVATVGAILYDDAKAFKIKKSKIRGEVSEGMICAEDELGLGTSHEGIMVLDSNASPGTPASAYFKIKKETIYEIGLTPNRIDGASHFGVARDLAAYLNQFEKKQAHLPSVDAFQVDNEDLIIPIQIVNTDACPRYTGLTMKNIKVGPSPEWLQSRLKSIGLAPINNVVDVTNFVLHETGQPLHAFDADKITGKKIIVKTLKEGSKFITLDGEERSLSDKDLMICNIKEGMCIAGVFGGIDSGVSENTTSIFLESARFDPVYIRKTSRRHLLNTDASFRFERGADPEMTIYALKRAALLIKEITGAEISSPVQDEYPILFKPVILKLYYKNQDRLIGNVIPKEKTIAILESLDFEILKQTEEYLSLRVPLYRVDVTREADVIEEILRIYGYNQVNTGLQSKISINYFEKPDKEKVVNQLSDLLSSNGFYEIMSNSLTKGAYYEKNTAFDEEVSVKLFNPLSQDLNVMRQSLIFGGLEAIIYNINRKRSHLKLFEFGTCYRIKNKEKAADSTRNFKEEQKLAILVTGNATEGSWNLKERKADFYYLKGIVSKILQRTGINERNIQTSGETSGIFSEALKYSINGKELCQLGMVSKATLNQMDIKQSVYFAEFSLSSLLDSVKNSVIQYKPLPKYPEVKRDLSLLLDKNVRFDQILDLAYKTEKRLLKNVKIFDLYQGDKISNNKKSYAVNFTIQDTEKTLTDKQIDKIMRNLIHVYTNKLGAEIR